MKISVVDPRGHTALHKPAAGDVPHATIEPNTSCNIRCVHCYASDDPVVKPLEQVLAEVDWVCERRKLDSITLLGGEPTLHPQLPAIIEHVKARGITCMLLTNGLRLLAPGGAELLEELVRAGLDRFLLHVDEGQAHVHEDVHQARHQLAVMLEERGVWFGLALTLCAGQEGTLPGVMRAFGLYRWFDGVLVTLAFDPDRAWLPDIDDPDTPDLAAVHRALARDLGIQPTAYLPSSLDDQEVCWLMYMYALDSRGGACFSVSPRFNTLYRRLHRRVTGREFFAEPPDPRWAPFYPALLGGLEVLLAPG